MSELRTSSDGLQAKAEKLAALEAERAEHESRVEAIASELSRAWQGKAGTAIQTALEKYRDEAADTRMKQGVMAQNLYQATAMYTTADEAGQQALATEMNI